MMKPMVLHSNQHLHPVTPAKEEQWRAWNNVNSVSCMQPQNPSARRLFNEEVHIGHATRDQEMQEHYS